MGASGGMTGRSIPRLVYPARTVTSKLDTAGVFERVFDAYRAQAGLFLPVAFVIFLPVAIVQGLLRSGHGTHVALSLLAVLLGIIATFTYEGVVVEAVRDIQDGVRDFTIGGLLRSVAPV